MDRRHRAGGLSGTGPGEQRPLGLSGAPRALRSAGGPGRARQAAPRLCNRMCFTAPTPCRTGACMPADNRADPQDIATLQCRIGPFETERPMPAAAPAARPGWLAICRRAV
ncbi:hypothetical protein OF001_U100031 [Pseudomonas sp. OF001]|nr:hypothetical protein OF001_U100031 [Pseudomonas sp. OF001]